jgi:hypothetical protein
LQKTKREGLTGVPRVKALFSPLQAMATAMVDVRAPSVAQKEETEGEAGERVVVMVVVGNETTKDYRFWSPRLFCSLPLFIFSFPSFFFLFSFGSSSH